MPPKKKKLSTLQKSINKKYRQFGTGRGWKEEHYFNRTKIGTLIRDRTTRGNVKRRVVAIARHYEDYLTRPYRKPTSRNYIGPGVPMGSLGPDIIFTIQIDPEKRVALERDILGMSILSSIIKSFNHWFQAIVMDIQREFVGDPRTFGGSKGKVPRGGTGYMRQMTRAYLERQIMMNKNFGYNLFFSIPVKYAAPTNAKSKNQLSHTNVEGYRIVDYLSNATGTLKPKYKKVRLNDPEAVSDFYNKTIEASRDLASKKIKTLINRLANQHNATMLHIKDTFGNPIKIDIDMFDFYPSEFNDLM